MLGNDGQVQPAFIQKSARHKHINSTMRYIQPSLKSSLAMSDILCGNDPDKGWSERFTGRRHTQIPFLNSLQVQDAAQNSDPWWVTGSAPTKISSAQKEPPGPPTQSQPPKRKADENPGFHFGKRRSTAGPQSHPTSVEGGEVQSAVTPLRSETPREESTGILQDPGPSGSTQGVGTTFPYPNSIGALRNRLTGISISTLPASPQEPAIPSVEEEIPPITSPQEDLEDEEDFVTGEGIGSTEYEI